MNDAKKSIDTADFGDLFGAIDKALKTRLSSKYSAPPYKQCQGIVLRSSISDSEKEQAAFDRLSKKWSPPYFVFTQLHYWRLGAPPLSIAERRNYVADFVLCDDAGEVLLAIEYEGMRGGYVGRDNKVVFSQNKNGKRERITTAKVAYASTLGINLLMVGQREIDNPIELDSLVGESLAQPVALEYKLDMLSRGPALSLKNVEAVAYHHAVANIDVVDLEIAGMRYELETRHSVSVRVEENNSGATAIVTVDDLAFVGEGTLREHSVLDDVLRVASRLAEYHAFRKATKHFATEGEA